MALPTKAWAAPCERAICTATVWLPAVTGTTAWTVRVWPSWQVTVAESSRSSSVTAPNGRPSTVIRLRRRASPAGPPLARSAVVLPRTRRTPALGAVTALLTAVVNVALAKASKMAAMGSSSASTHGSSRLPAVAVVARARSLGREAVEQVGARRGGRGVRRAGRGRAVGGRGVGHGQGRGGLPDLLLGHLLGDLLDLLLRQGGGGVAAGSGPRRTDPPRWRCRPRPRPGRRRRG